MDVVLPTPPFWLHNAMTRAGPCAFSTAGSGMWRRGRPVGPSSVSAGCGLRDQGWDDFMFGGGAGRGFGQERRRIGRWSVCPRWNVRFRWLELRHRRFHCDKFFDQWIRIAAGVPRSRNLPGWTLDRGAPAAAIHAASSG